MKSPVRKIILGLVLFVVAIGCLAGYSAWKRDTEFNALIAELKADGLPTSFADLNDFYKVPEGVEDTTMLWTQTIDNLDMASMTDQANAKTLPYISQADPPDPTADWDQLQAARDFLQQMQPTMNLLRTAMETDGAVRFEVDFSDGLNTLLTQTQECRNLARLLCLDNQVAYRDKDFERLHENLMGLLHLSKILRTEPTLVSQLVVAALHSMACDQVVIYVSLCDWNDDQLAELQQAAASLDFRANYRVAQAGEVAFMLGAMEQVRGFSSIIFGGAKTQMLKHRQEVLEATELPWHEMRDRHEELAASLTKPKGLLQTYQANITNMLQPAMQHTTEAMARAQARQDCLVALLGIARHRLQNNEPITSLTDLPATVLPEGASANWVDPFDGEPLRFSTSDEAITVYSVGRNEKDDGGNVINMEDNPATDAGWQMKLSD